MTHVKLANKIETPYKEKGDVRLNFKRKAIEIDRNEPQKMMSFNPGTIFPYFSLLRLIWEKRFHTLK